MVSQASARSRMSVMRTLNRRLLITPEFLELAQRLFAPTKATSQHPRTRSIRRIFSGQGRSFRLFCQCVCRSSNQESRFHASINRFANLKPVMPAIHVTRNLDK